MLEHILYLIQSNRFSNLVQTYSDIRRIIFV